MKIYNGIDGLIGKTPLVRLKNTEEKYGSVARLYAKLESFNPTGSAKDRAALFMLEDAERKGLIKKGATIIEPTSGNTGIGLAAIAAMRGYRAIIVMPDTMSRERKALMRAYGAEIVESDGKLGMKGSIALAKEIYEKCENAFIPDQFNNPANAEAHRMMTGPEIFEDTDGEVDVFVATIGTGGTITGVGEYLKSVKPSVKVVGVEPSESPFLTKGTAGAHKIQGIGAGFKPGILNEEVIDDIITVCGEDAYSFSRNLAKHEGILVGISSGAGLCAAVKLSKMPEYEGKNIVVLLTDGGERYLSTELFV